MNSDVALARQFIETLAYFIAGGVGLIALVRLFAARRGSPGRGAEDAPPGASSPGATEPSAVLRTPLWLRLGTLLALAVAVFVPAFVGGAAWLTAVCVLVSLGLLEIWGALSAVGAAPHRWSGLLAGLALPLAAFWAGPAGVGAALGAGFLGVALTALLTRSDVSLFHRLGGTWLGVSYVGLLGAYLVLVQATGGFGALIWFLMVVQLADVGGLMAGILGGRHKLVPRLSPAKTWEGLAGSVAAAVFASWAFAFALPHVAWIWLVAVAVLLALTGLVGDLLASGFKRAAGLKDFGRVLPGHGGVLDRFDGYLYTAPIFWGCLVLLTR